MEANEKQFTVSPFSVGAAGLTSRPGVWDNENQRVVGIGTTADWEPHYYQGTAAGWAAAERRAAELNQG